jgi:hypothetical protein
MIEKVLCISFSTTRICIDFPFIAFEDVFKFLNFKTFIKCVKQKNLNAVKIICNRTFHKKIISKQKRNVLTHK